MKAKKKEYVGYLYGSVLKTDLLERRYRFFFHRDTTVFIIAELYDNRVVRDIDHHSVETARRANHIADLQRRQHPCYSLLFLFLRSHQEKIEKSDDEHHINNHDHSAALGGISCQQT